MLNVNNQINKTPHALEFVLRFSRCLVLSYRSCTEVYLPFMQYCQTLQLQLPSDSCWEKNIYHKPQLARCLFLHLWHLFGVIYICLVWILWLGQLNTWCLHPHHHLPQYSYDLHVVMYSLQEPRNNLSIIDILKIQILKNPNISRTNFPTSVCNAFCKYTCILYNDNKMFDFKVYVAVFFFIFNSVHHKDWGRFRHLQNYDKHLQNYVYPYPYPPISWQTKRALT